MFEKLIAIFAAICLFVVIGVISYGEIAKEEYTVIVDLKTGEDPFFALKSIVPSDSYISEIKEVDKKNNSYELRVITKRNKKGLIDWLQSSSRVDKVTPKS